MCDAHSDVLAGQALRTHTPSELSAFVMAGQEHSPPIVSDILHVEWTLSERSRDGTRPAAVPLGTGMNFKEDLFRVGDLS